MVALASRTGYGLGLGVSDVRRPNFERGREGENVVWCTTGNVSDLVVDGHQGGAMAAMCGSGERWEGLAWCRCNDNQTLSSLRHAIVLALQNRPSDGIALGGEDVD